MENKSRMIKAAAFAIFTVSVLFLISHVVFAYPITGNAVKTEEAAIGAGVTPDSFLYFLDKALDNINLALTFDSTEKAKKGLNVARERLMEAREMAVANKLEAAQRAQQEHAEALSVVQGSIGELKRANSTHELEEEIGIENELEEHEREVEEVQAELNVKLEVKGEITPEQQQLIDSGFSLMQNKTGEVKIRIENKKGETKIKIKAETGKSEAEVEEEVEKLEEKVGLSELKREKAEEQIADALEEIAGVNTKLLKVNLTEFNATAINELIFQAEQKIARAQEAFNETKFGETFGFANAAEQLAKNAEKLLERILEHEEEREAEEKEIEVEIEGGIAKVKIKIGGNKLKYRTPFTTEDDLLNDIASRTGLSLEEVKALAKIKVEEVEIEEVKKVEEEGKEIATNASEEIEIQRITIEDRVKEKEKVDEEQKESEEGKSASNEKSNSGKDGKSGSSSGGSDSGSGKGSNSDGDD